MLVTFSTFDLFKGAVVEFSINLVSGPEYTTTPENQYREYNMKPFSAMQILRSKSFSCSTKLCMKIQQLIESKLLKNNKHFLLKGLRFYIYPANKC